MNYKSFIFLIFPIFALTLFGQGCFGGGNQATGPDGGVWKTADRAENWTNKRALVDGPKVTAEAANISVRSMVFDPQDNKTIYLATDNLGLVHSNDAGDSWLKDTNLKLARVYSVAVDPKNKCVVYVTSANKIYKTENCTRDWEQIFFDPRTDKIFTQIVVDWFNPSILYAGTSEGDVFKSTDAGSSWQTSKRIEGTVVTAMVMDPRDSRVLYVGTSGDGIWKTLDGGNTWIHIEKQFGEEFREARRVTRIVVDPKVTDTIYIVSKYGIIKSPDKGEAWQALVLPTPPSSIDISSFAIDPNDNKKMIYTSPTAVTLSSDGGVSWTSKKLPTTKAGSFLLIDPKDGNIIYLGTQPPKK